jgi:hypothetical protein
MSAKQPNWAHFWIDYFRAKSRMALDQMPASSSAPADQRRARARDQGPMAGNGQGLTRQYFEATSKYLLNNNVSPEDVD